MKNKMNSTRGFLKSVLPLWLLVQIVFGGVSFGDVFDEDPVPVEDVPSFPIPSERERFPSAPRFCEVRPGDRLNQVIEGDLLGARQAVLCGDYQSALELTRKAQRGILAQIERGGGPSTTERGWCYDKKACGGSVIGNTIVTEGTCNALGGKSWKKTSPTFGNCKNI